MSSDNFLFLCSTVFQSLFELTLKSSNNHFISASLSVQIAEDSIFLKTFATVSLRFPSFFAFFKTLKNNSLGKI